jgi:hypothetical protein
MPSRYSNTKVKRDKSGIRVYKTTYYPDIPISDNDEFIYPRFGERLDLLAHRFYGDVTLWWVIAKANGLKGKVFVPQDTEIRIPGNVSKVLEDFNNLNN